MAQAPGRLSPPPRSPRRGARRPCCSAPSSGSPRCRSGRATTSRSKSGSPPASLALVERRAAGEPAAYLLGRREFFGREFGVDERVLIPRPETELLVEIALALPLPDAAAVLDIGTGSGCIALTLAAERPSWKLLATDLSLGALACARANARRLGLDDRVDFVAADLAAAVRPRDVRPA